MTSCKTSESLKQQRLNQLIGQVVRTEEKTEEGGTVPSDKSQPAEKQQEGTVMTGAAQQSAKICHSNKPANLQGDDARRGGRLSTCDCIKEAAGRSRRWTRGETKDYGYGAASWWQSAGAPAAVAVTGTQLIVHSRACDSAFPLKCDRGAPELTPNNHGVTMWLTHKNLHNSH